MKYRRFHFQWKIVRLGAISAAAVVLAAGMLAAVLDGTSAARTVTAPHKSPALARAEATGFAGLHGGHGSGHATARSRVIRTAKTPALTKAQLRTRRLAAEMPVLTPHRVQGAQ